MEKFAFDHIQRLIANNDAHEYDGMIADTVTAYEGYFGAITDEDVSLALQKSYTHNVDEIIDNFKQTVRDKEIVVSFRFGRDSAEYIEFFPRGLSEYNQADKTSVENLMIRMVTVATKYVSVVKQPFVDLFTQFAAEYHAARELQGQQKGIVTAEKTVSETTRDQVEIQLNRNLLILAEKFLGNPNRGLDFFDQSIIRKASGGSGETNGDDNNGVISIFIITTDQTIFKIVELGISGPAGKIIIILWGDGTQEEVTCDNTTQFFNHEYTTHGTFDITLSGEFEETEEIHSNNSNLIAATIKGMKYLSSIIMQNNNYDQPTVDEILIEADESGVENGEMSLVGNPSPSAAGLAAKANLEAKGWL